MYHIRKHCPLQNLIALASNASIAVTQLCLGETNVLSPCIFISMSKSEKQADINLGMQVFELDLK